MYAATRMLYSLARDGKAPRIFGRVSRSGVPLWALLATTVVAALCFFSFIFSPKAVYIWLLKMCIRDRTCPGRCRCPRAR